MLGGLRVLRQVEMRPTRYYKTLRAGIYMDLQKQPRANYVGSSTARAGLPKIANGVLRMIDKSISQDRCSMYSKS